MSDKRRAIGEKLRRARSRDALLSVSKQWGTDWYNEQGAIIRKLKSAIASKNAYEIQAYLQQLEAVNEKRHSALPRVFERLIDFAPQPQAEEETEGEPK